MIDRFPPHVLDHLKWYVYRLVDPRNGETFYVGKGQQDRVFDHLKGLVTQEDDGLLPLKFETIRSIQASGHNVIHYIHRHGLPDDATALILEAALIEAYENLTNEIGGHGSQEFGSRTVNELLEFYAMEEAELSHKLIIIDVSRTFNRKRPTRQNLYDSVRFMWRLQLKRARRFDLVLAHRGGVILGAFRANEWLPATAEHFPEFASSIKRLAERGKPGRIGFVGSQIDDPEITDLYVRKRVPSAYRTAPQTSCRYFEPG